MVGNNNQQANSISDRRRFLYGALGAAGLAGCIGDDDDIEPSPDDITGPDDEVDTDGAVDQTFVLPTTDNPEEGSVIMRGPPMPEEFETRYGFAGHVYQTIHEPIVYGRFLHRAYASAPGDPHLGLLADLEIEDDLARFTLRDDIYWSDGEPIRALDGPGGTFLKYRLNFIPEAGQYMYDDRDIHDWAPMLFDDVRFPDGHDGKVWEMISHHDGLVGEHLADDENRGWFLLRTVETHGMVNWPTHIEPYDDLVHEILDEVERGLDGEEVRGPDEITAEHIDESTYEKFRDPENVVSSGAWTLDEIRGAEEWVLTPNEHHPRADEVNFSEIRLPWIEEDHRLHAELQADRLDYGQAFTPPELVEEIEAGTYTQHLSPEPEDGGIIGFHHADPVFGQAKVRQAIAYAIDQYEIAETVHPDITFPVEVQGGDMFGREVFISDEWVDENLVSYEPDLDKAVELMQEAGFERNTDDVWLHEGEPIEFLYPTPDDTPIAERIVVDQLEDFGFRPELQSFEDDAYGDQFFQGEFRIFPEDPDWGAFMVGHFMSAIYARWNNIITHPGRVIGWSMYNPPDVNEEIAELLDDYASGLIIEDHVDPWIEIPPIGEPDAEPERFYIMDEIHRTMYLGEQRTGSEEWLDVVRKLLWATNWHLPVYQMYFIMDQHFLNQENWQWPTDHPTWEFFGESLQPSDYLSMGYLTADPENPK